MNTSYSYKPKSKSEITWELNDNGISIVQDGQEQKFLNYHEIDEIHLSFQQSDPKYYAYIPDRYKCKISSKGLNYEILSISRRKKEEGESFAKKMVSDIFLSQKEQYVDFVKTLASKAALKNPAIVVRSGTSKVAYGFIKAFYYLYLVCLGFIAYLLLFGESNKTSIWDDIMVVAIFLVLWGVFYSVKASKKPIIIENGQVPDELFMF